MLNAEQHGNAINLYPPQPVRSVMRPYTLVHVEVGLEVVEGVGGAFGGLHYVREAYSIVWVAYLDMRIAKRTTPQKQQALKTVQRFASGTIGTVRQRWRI